MRRKHAQRFNSCFFEEIAVDRVGEPGPPGDRGRTGKNREQKPKVRKDFPETWLWMDHKLKYVNLFCPLMYDFCFNFTSFAKRLLSMRDYHLICLYCKNRVIKYFMLFVFDFLVISEQRKLK